jgi:membrane protein DedA with SNARE-associated domain
MNIPHLETLIITTGYPVVFLCAMGECMGLPLPGETALLIAAAAAGTSHIFNIWWVIAAAAAGAIVGDTIGYWIGRKGGRALVLRLMGKFFIKPEHLEKAERFFARHGGKAVFFGRSVSYLRVLTALLAGVADMYNPKFLAYNVAGGITWAVVFGLAGYTFGRNLKVLREYIHEFAVVVLIVIVIAVALYFIGKRLGWFHKKA